MSIRKASRDDQASMLACWNESTDLDQISARVLNEKIWEDEDINPGCALVATSKNRIEGLAIGVARTTGPGSSPVESKSTSRGYIKLLAVHPNARRQGVGTALLGHVEDELFRLGCATVRLGESAPNYLLPGIDNRDTALVAFFEAQGYVRFGETYNLSVDLAGQVFDPSQEERTLRADGVTVCRAEPSHRSTVFDFLSIHWPAWQSEVLGCFDNSPISLHLAFRDQSLLGFSGYEANNRGTGWFGPMGTADEARGRGIGGVLLKKCLEDMKLAGFKEAVIPWVGPVRFYQEKVNARMSRVFYRYEKSI